MRIANPMCSTVQARVPAPSWARLLLHRTLRMSTDIPSPVPIVHTKASVRMPVTTVTAHPSSARLPLRPRTSVSSHLRQPTPKTRTMLALQELEQATLRDSAASRVDVVTVPNLSASAQDVDRPSHLRLRPLLEDTLQMVF